MMSELSNDYPFFTNIFYVAIFDFKNNEIQEIFSTTSHLEFKSYLNFQIVENLCPT